MAPGSRKKVFGLAWGAGAVGLVVAGWIWVHADEISTDNAYVRGDVTSIAPKVGGYVTAVAVEDNQTVHAGDVLFSIDDRDYRARFGQATANVDAAVARLANVDAETQLQHAVIRQAEAQQRSAEAELTRAARASERRRELIRSDAVSQAQVDDTDAARANAEASLTAAQAKVDAERQRITVLEAQREAAIAALAQTQAARELAQIDLDNTIIRAPVDGAVGNRQVRIGRLVTPGVSLIELVPTDNVWIVANFKETRIEHIRPGLRAHIRIDGFPDQRFEGVVDSFAPGSGSAFSLLPADNATGNFVRVVQRVPVKIRLVSNPVPGRLVPGLSARVDIDSMPQP
jgi:membrane fusion protein (multidrug efflux system)